MPDSKEDSKKQEMQERQSSKTTRNSHPPMPAVVTPSRFDNVYLLHGKGGSPNGSVLQLEAILGRQFPCVRFHRPELPHRDAELQAELSYDWMVLRWLHTVAPHSLLVGISLGGLMAAKVQEFLPEYNFHVLTFMAPTSYDELRLEKKVENRAAFYSSKDEIIRGRNNWSQYANLSWDVDWLRDHNLDKARYACVFLIGGYMAGRDLRTEVDSLFGTAVSS